MSGRDDSNWEVLAGLRFVLAWIVICGHVTFYFADTDPFTRWLGDLGGKTAVVGFLIVSGYSIAASIGSRPDGFYGRRLFRIYPLYLTAILFAYGTQLWFGGIAHMPSGETIAGNGLAVVLGNLVFLQTFVVKPMAFDGPVWSLAVEVSHYVAAPSWYGSTGGALLGLLAVSALAYVAPRHDDWGRVYFVFSHLNALAYAWAWLLGFVLHGTRRGVLLPIFAIGGAVLIALNPLSNPEPAAPATYLVVFGCILAAATAARDWVFPKWLGAGLTYLGDLSYPLYLIHFPALAAAVALGLTGAVAAMAVALLLSAAALFLIDVRLKIYVRSVIRRMRAPAAPTPLAGPG